MLSIIGVVLVSLCKGDDDVYPALIFLGLLELSAEIGICAEVFGG